MKKVFGSHSEVAHVWAARTQSEGSASRMFFYEDTIYSYGRHFPIAKFRNTPDGKTVVLFTYQRYSASTGKHKTHVHRAINHYDVVYCYDPEYSAHENLKTEEVAVDILLENIAATKHKKRISNLSDEIVSIIDRAKKYADVMGVKYPDWMAIPDDMREAAAKRAVEKAEQAEKERRAREIAMIEQRMKDIERLSAWLEDTTVHTNGFYNLDVKLRIKGDEIQTSHGASIPTEHAVKIWPLLHKAHESAQPVTARPDHTLHLGHYKFNSFEDDVLTVGCHRIPYVEIARMAEQLGLLEPAHA